MSVWRVSVTLSSPGTDHASPPPLLLSSSADVCLAVLMPFQVTVFTMNMAAGTVEHGTHYAINAAYSHKLKRSSFNIFSGNFSGAKGKVGTLLPNDRSLISKLSRRCLR